MPPAARAEQTWWDYPHFLERTGVRFPLAASGDGVLAVAWQEFEKASPNANSGSLWLSAALTRDGLSWIRRVRIAGPLPYNEPEMPIASMAVDAAGRVLLAYLSDDRTVTLLSTDDSPAGLSRIAEIQAPQTCTSPVLSVKADGGLLLFVTLGSEEGKFLSLHYSVSPDGKEWSALAPMTAEGEVVGVTMTPRHVSMEGRESVIFLHRSGRGDEHFLLKTSADGGRTWGPKLELTRGEQYREYSQGQWLPADDFQNQVPSLALQPNGRIGMVWQRFPTGSTDTQVYYQELDATGKPIDRPERLTGGGIPYFGPRIVVAGGKVMVLWLDPNARGGSSVMITEKTADGWSPAEILGASAAGNASIAVAVPFTDGLHVFWENRAGAAAAADRSLVEMRPDRSVAPPVLAALDFRPGVRINHNMATVRTRAPADSSGIAGYRYRWIHGGKTEEESSFASTLQPLTLPAAEDGPWELEVEAIDVAGNVSRPASITFVRDTTPPEQVKLALPEADARGYLLSNTGSLAWDPPEGDEIASYIYDFRFFAGDERELAARKPLPADLPPYGSYVPHYDLDNQDNGIYELAVAAVDTAGNRGAVARGLVKLNKYVPVTIIGFLDSRKDAVGNLEVSIAGKGFTLEGTIQTIYLDRDRNPPYDYAFQLADGAYTVESDRRISGLRVTDMVDTGAYYVGLLHPVRRIRFTTYPAIAYQSPGTVKLGDFRAYDPNQWVRAWLPRVSLSFGTVLIVTVIAFLCFLFLVSVRALAGAVQENREIRGSVTALIEGRPIVSEEERIRKMKEIRKRQFGLRLKFSLLIGTLVFLVVLIVAIPLGYQTNLTQTQSLASSLKSEVGILMGSMSTRAGTILKGEEYTDMANVPRMISELNGQALDATVTARSQPWNVKSGYEYLWVSNAAQWQEMIAAEDFSLGLKKITDELSGKVVPEIQQKIDSLAAGDEYQSLVRQKKELSVKRTAAQASPVAARQAEAKELAALLTLVDENLAKKENEFGNILDSIPAFNPEKLVDEYLFCRPIVYRLTDDEQHLYRGMIRMTVSTKAVQDKIRQSTLTLIRTTMYMALAAILLGILGAITLATITVTPIRRLETHVKKIRDTADLSEWKEPPLRITTRDEIRTLADTVNEMTHGLVSAEKARRDLLMGKEVQMMFIPLDKTTMEITDDDGRKHREEKSLSTGAVTTDRVEIFGYYHGAKGVSGDYFDYIPLDSGKKKFAVIKCDASGKGVSAALIMVEVATLFIDHFSQWRAVTEKLEAPKLPAAEAGALRQRLRELEKIEELVYTINRMIEGRGFKGKFAALAIAIMDSETGVMRFVFAGDNVLHVYRSATGKMETLKMPGGPAAGSFPDDMVRAGSGYKQAVHKMESGDAVFLYTDGFEESRRYLRDPTFTVIKREAKSTRPGEPSKMEDAWEQLGTDRLDEISEAVFKRRKYVLTKEQNPIQGETLSFDFTKCEGTLEEVSLAMVAVERVFRLYQDPSAGSGSIVQVDMQADRFLSRYFDQYDRFFSHPVGGADPKAEEGGGKGKGRKKGRGRATAAAEPARKVKLDENMAGFTHLKEDDQYDDLTLLIIRKK